MPVVPYQPGRVENATAQPTYSSLRATPEDFGSNQAAQIGQIADMTGRLNNNLYQQQQEGQQKLDNNYARDAMTNAQLEMNKHLSENVYNKQGFAAANIAPDVQAKFQEISDKYSANLQNDNQRAMFNQQYQGEAAGHLASVYNFQAKSRDDLTHQTRLAENDAAIQTGAMNYNNPDMVAKNEFTVDQNTRASWAPYGKEVADQKAAEAVSHYHMEIADAAGRYSATDGLRYIEKYQDKFQPTQLAILKDKFEHQAISEMADQKAMLLASQPDMTEAKAYQMVDGDKTITDPEQKKMIISGVNSRLSAQRADAVVQSRAYQEGAWKQFITDPTHKIDPTWPPAMTLRMQTKQKEWSDEQAAGNFKSKYGELLDVAATDKAAFSKLNLFEYRPGFDVSERQWNQLNSMQKELLKGGTTPQTTAFNKAVADAKSAALQMSDFKVLPKDTDQVKSAKIDGLHQYMEDYAERLNQQTEKDPNALKDWKTASDIRAQLLNEKVLPYKFLGMTIPYFQNHTGVKQYQIDTGVKQDPNAPPPTPIINQSIPDKQKAALLVRESLKNGRINQDEALKQLNAIGYRNE